GAGARRIEAAGEDSGTRAAQLLPGSATATEMRRQWLVGVLLVAAALVTGCRPAPASRGRIDMLDVRATVEPDGDLAVVETIRIVPDASGRVGLDRLIDSEFADATTLVRAVVDGGIVEEAGGGLSVVST